MRLTPSRASAGRRVESCQVPRTPWQHSQGVVCMGGTWLLARERGLIWFVKMILRRGCYATVRLRPVRIAVQRTAGEPQACPGTHRHRCGRGSRVTQRGQRRRRDNRNLQLGATIPRHSSSRRKPTSSRTLTIRRPLRTPRTFNETTRSQDFQFGVSGGVTVQVRAQQHLAGRGLRAGVDLSWTNLPV